jgi:hypothetical protein
LDFSLFKKRKRKKRTHIVCVTPIICLLSFASVELMKKYKVKKNNIFLLDSVLRNIFPFLDTIIIPQFAKEKTMPFST